MTNVPPIQLLRTRMGMTQRDFATELGLMSGGHLSRLESGDLSPSLAVALKLEELGRNHGVPIDAADLNDGVRLARAACLGGCEAVSALGQGAEEDLGAVHAADIAA